MFNHTPISSTLTVEINGSPAPRSRTKGFDYDAPSDAIVFNGIVVPKGSTIVTGYSRF